MPVKSPTIRNLFPVMNAQALQQLAGLLSQLQVGQTVPTRTLRNRRRRQKKRAKKQGLNPAPVAMSAAPVSGRKRKNKRSGGNIAAGEVSISRVEFVTEVTTNAQGTAVGSFVIEPEGFSWLKNIAKAFERVRWQSCSFEWRPAVGSTVSGTLAMGIDWAIAATTVDKPTVMACTPSIDTQVWQKVPNFVVPGSRLMSRAWYLLPEGADTKVPVQDRAPGSLLYACKGDSQKTMGEIWIRYSLVLSGTRKV